VCVHARADGVEADGAAGREAGEEVEGDAEAVGPGRGRAGRPGAAAEGPQVPEEAAPARAQGIPNRLRGQVWARLAQTEELRAQQGGSIFDPVQLPTTRHDTTNDTTNDTTHATHTHFRTGWARLHSWLLALSRSLMMAHTRTTRSGNYGAANAHFERTMASSADGVDWPYWIGLHDGLQERLTSPPQPLPVRAIYSGAAPRTATLRGWPLLCILHSFP
jgi:hypothetical protein